MSRKALVPRRMIQVGTLGTNVPAVPGKHRVVGTMFPERQLRQFFPNVPAVPGVPTSQ